MTTGLDIRASDNLQPVSISFKSGGDRLIVLGIFNAILRILSLGLYSFWAKTEVRKRLWSFTRIDGEPLEYTGTGKELFLGFLIVFAVFILPLMAAGIAVALLFRSYSAALPLYQGAVYLVIFLLIGNAMYRAQRYRLSRTRWRGIRGALTGSPARYGWAYFWTLALPAVLVIALSFGISVLIGPQVGGAIVLLGIVLALWVLPWRANKLQGLMTNDMRFGDRPLSYTGTAGPLYKRYLYAWLGSALVYLAAIGATAVYVIRSGALINWQMAKIPPTLVDILTLAAIWIVALFVIAVLTAWYRASQYRHFAAHTHFEGATFAIDATGPSLMWVVVTNWLMQVLALILGFAAGTALLILIGPAPETEAATDAAAMAAREPGLLATISVIVPIVLFTTVAATFAQFRWTRYFVSRLKLNGAIDLGRVLQGQDQGLKRGEGLAQVFDLDAF